MGACFVYFDTVADKQPSKIGPERMVTRSMAGSSTTCVNYGKYPAPSLRVYSLHCRPYYGVYETAGCTVCCVVSSRAWCIKKSKSLITEVDWPTSLCHITWRSVRGEFYSFSICVFQFILYFSLSIHSLFLSSNTFFFSVFDSFSCMSFLSFEIARWARFELSLSV